MQKQGHKECKLQSHPITYWNGKIFGPVGCRLVSHVFQRDVLVIVRGAGLWRRAREREEGEGCETYVNTNCTLMIGPFTPKTCFASACKDTHNPRDEEYDDAIDTAPL